MRVKFACAARNGAPDGYSGAAPASDHLSNGRRSARADDHAAKLLLFELPISIHVWRRCARTQTLFAGTHLSLASSGPLLRLLDRQQGRIDGTWKSFFWADRKRGQLQAAMHPWRGGTCGTGWRWWSGPGRPT